MAAPRKNGINSQVRSPDYDKFDGGLNVRDSWQVLLDNELTVADNLRLDDGGVIRQRGGWAKLADAAVGTSGNLIGLVQGSWVLSGTLTRYVVATDGTKVFWLNGTAWTDITGAISMSPASDTLVSFLSMNNLLIGHDGKNAPWTWDGSAGSIALLAGSPPTASMGIVWQNRVFFAGVPTARTRLYYSDLGNPSLYGASNYIDIPSPYDGDEITGLAVLYGNLIIFKRYSIYIIQGDAPENFVISKTNSAVGCVSQYSVISVDNLVYFVSDKGLYAMNLSNTKQVCYKVEPRYSLAVPNQSQSSLYRNRIQALHYRKRNEIWMALDASASGHDQHDRVLVHNYNVVDKNGDPAVAEHKTYGNILVILDTNDYIDFTEDGGAEISAQLTAGTYPVGASSSEAGTLCALIKTQMEAVNGASTYTVTYSGTTDKITITKNSGVFVLKFASGANTLKNASQILGFSVSNTASAISATSSAKVADRAAASFYQVCTAPSIYADYNSPSGGVLPMASFYDKYVYVFTEGIYTDAASVGSATNINTKFFSGYKNFGDTDATKTLRNIWTDLYFAGGTPHIHLGVLGSDLTSETVAELIPTSPSTFYNTKQPAGSAFGSSPQGKYFKFGFSFSDGGVFNFFHICFDIVWNGVRN